MPWSTVTEIWERPNYWIISEVADQFTTLPVNAIPSTNRVFFRSEASSAA
ncbi:hypothetical protein [Rhizobium multihospitium]